MTPREVVRRAYEALNDQNLTKIESLHHSDVEIGPPGSGLDNLRDVRTTGSSSMSSKGPILARWSPRWESSQPPGGACRTRWQLS